MGKRGKAQSLRISWLSNAPFAQTGYGNQTRLFARRIKDNLKHDVAITAFWGHEGSIINWDGIPVYGKGFHLYGQDVMAAHASNFRADILISLMDAWVIQTGLLQDYKDKWYPWFPIDHDPLPKPIADAVKKSPKPITMSLFGKRMMEDVELDCFYVPHGVETDIFKPVDRKEAREKMLLPKDVFIVGMVAANKGSPPRKAFFQNIAAFAELHKKHNDTVMYIHTIHGGAQATAEMVNLVEFCNFIGLEVGRDVIFPDQYYYMLGYPDDRMNMLYNAMDVHMLVSMGEGFGIPILEAQSAGTPVIVGDWTSMSELCMAGWKVDKAEAEPFYTPLGSWQYLPRAGAIADKLELAYHNKNNLALRKKARDMAIAYDADLVTEQYWKPCLDEIAASLPEQKADKGAGLREGAK